MGKDRRGEEIQQREQDTWRLRVMGLTQWQIADRLSLSQAAVSKILARVGVRLAQEFVEEVRSIKAQQTAILDHVTAEALSAWERSKEDGVTEQTVKGKTAGKAEGESGQAKAQITRTVVGQSGNPAHLAQARGALADIRAIWGLDSPARAEVAGPGGGPIPMVTEIVVELPRPNDPGAEPVESAPPEMDRAALTDIVVDLPDA
jgi:DNA-binding CsgD family transcriptional regulator